jgi:hypothetical protein
MRRLGRPAIGMHQYLEATATAVLTRMAVSLSMASKVGEAVRSHL